MAAANIAAQLEALFRHFPAAIAQQADQHPTGAARPPIFPSISP
jgi:hypothetical protein